MDLKVTSHDAEWSPRYFAIIVGIFCALYVISSAANSKLIEIAGFVLPGGILTFPLCCIITDMLTEIYGFNRTRQAIWTVLASVILYALFMALVGILPAPDFWPHQAAYDSIFANAPRIVLAGCLAWLVGEFVNSYIMSRLKILQNAKGMSLRFIGSTAIAQFFDTIVFGLVAFAGTMPWPTFLIMMLSAWVAKVLYEALALPLSVPITKWVKRLEGVEHFDKQKLSVI